MSEVLSREEALAKLKVPAIGLIITGAIGIVYMLIQAVQLAMLDEVTEQMTEQMEQQNQDEEAVAFFEQWMGWMQSFGWIFVVVAIAGSVFVLMGGLKMMKGQSKGMCMAACIVSFLPFVSGCCILGLVFGIWGLVMLGKSEVAPAFETTVDTKAFE